MGGREWYHAGGIRGLGQLIAEHREAIEYDLLALGKNLDQLGTEALSWRDLKVIVRQQPRTSALSRALEPEAHRWGMAEQLLASIFDVLRFDVWRNSDPKKRGPEPKPLPRPGVASTEKADVLPMTASTVTELDAWLEERRASGKL